VFLTLFDKVNDFIKKVYMVSLFDISGFWKVPKLKKGIKGKDEYAR
jgi:hypothetical protein